MHRIVEVLCVDVFVLIRSSGDIFYARALLLVSIRRRRRRRRRRCRRRIYL